MKDDRRVTLRSRTVMAGSSNDAALKIQDDFQSEGWVSVRIESVSLLDPGWEVVCTGKLLKPAKLKEVSS